MKVLLVPLLVLSSTLVAISQRPGFDSVHRLDGGNTSHLFGINARGESQQASIGGKVGGLRQFPKCPTDAMALLRPRQSNIRVGAEGCRSEPALKVTFADGNRDLVLHYQSHTQTADSFDVVLRDVSRGIVLTLHYSMDRAS
jgi:alpha-galactosidase